MLTPSRLLKPNSIIGQCNSNTMRYFLIGIALGKFGNFSFFQIYWKSGQLSSWANARFIICEGDITRLLLPGSISKCRLAQ